MTSVVTSSFSTHIKADPEFIKTRMSNPEYKTALFLAVVGGPDQEPETGISIVIKADTKAFWERHLPTQPTQQSSVSSTSSRNPLNRLSDEKRKAFTDHFEITDNVGDCKLSSIIDLAATIPGLGRS